MEDKTGRRLRRWLIVPPVVLGILLVILVVRGREEPQRVAPEERARAVRVVAVPAVDVVPRALGYGSVEPATVWEAVAEVGGKIVEIHPRLKSGEILPKGTVLLRIDPADYRLAVAQIEADVRGAVAAIEELAVKESNYGASLDIEVRALKLNETDLARKRTLLARGTLAQARVDEEERVLLGRQQSVQAMRNALNLVPAEREILRAKVALYEARLADARLDLERTTIVLPFDARIGAVNVEHSQFAGAGQVLAVGDGIDVSEVAAQFPIDRLRHLVGADPDSGGLTLADMRRLPELFGLEAIVRLRSGDFVAEWQGRFARISETVDPQTRTMGLIIAVDDPYRQAQRGVRPPLFKNLFVEVELRGRPLPERVVVPRTALAGTRVYVVDRDNRLESRELTIAFRQTNFAVVEAGLQAGERVVVSDISPAIEGMLLAPVDDDDTVAALIAEAMGASTVK